MRKAPVAIDLLMAELPTYIYFTVFMLMVFWWIELYHRSTGRSDSEGFLGRMKPVFIVVNALMYTFFIIVLIIYAVKYQTVPRPPCFDAVDRSLSVCPLHRSSRAPCAESTRRRVSRVPSPCCPSARSSALFFSSLGVFHDLAFLLRRV